MTHHFELLLPLLRLKIRILLNSFVNWTSAGKTIAAVFVIFVTSSAMASGAYDLVSTFQMIPFGEYILEWVLALICIYLIILVLTGDMLTGHTLNAGQMSSDFAYLMTLPLSPASLIALKLFERMITDYIGLLLLLTGIFGIVFRNGFSLTGLFLGLMVYLQISFLTGLAINILTMLMQRLFRKATINNLFSVLGYLSLFLTLLPYLLVSSFPGQSLNWLIDWSGSFSKPVFKLVIPFRWLARTLLQTGSINEFYYFSLVWLACAVAGCLLFYFMIRLNWLTVTHSVSRKNAETGRIFTGFFQKELILLKSDFNMLINAILMPISIIILEIYFLKNFINLATSSQLLNLLYAAIVYFCMFGPINSVGAEGKSIAIIESLPMSVSDFVFKKFFFWLVIAETIFVPTSVITMYYMSYSTVETIKCTLLNAVFTMVCVWISIHISSVFPNFESKVLQQKSTMTGKVAGLLLMLLAAPIKSFDLLSLINLIVLIIALLLVRQITLASLKNRLDPDFDFFAPDSLHPYILLLLVFTGTEVLVRQFFVAFIPGYYTGLWSWLIASLMFYSASLFYVGNNLFSTQRKYKQKLFFWPGFKRFAVVLALSVILVWSVNYFITLSPESYLEISSDIKVMFEGGNLSGLSEQTVDQSILIKAFRFAVKDFKFLFTLLTIALCTGILSLGFVICVALTKKALSIILGLVAFIAVALPGFKLCFAMLWLFAFLVYRKTASALLVLVLTIPPVLTGFLTLLFS